MQRKDGNDDDDKNENEDQKFRNEFFLLGINFFHGESPCYLACGFNQLFHHCIIFVHLCQDGVNFYFEFINPIQRPLRCRD